MHTLGKKDPNSKKDQDRKHHTDQLSEPSSTHHPFILDLLLFEQRNQLFVNRRDVLRNISHLPSIITSGGFDCSRCELDRGDFPLFDETLEVRVGDLFGCRGLIVDHISQAVTVTDERLKDQYDHDREECEGKQGVVVKKIIIVIIIVILGVIHWCPLCRSV